MAGHVINSDEAKSKLLVDARWALSAGDRLKQMLNGMLGLTKMLVTVGEQLPDPKVEGSACGECPSGNLSMCPYSMLAAIFK